MAARAWSAMMRSETSVSWLAPYSTLARLGGFLDQGPEEIGIEIRELALQDGGEPLQSRAGINRRAGQGSHVALFVAVELHEDQVPQFDVAAAIARKAQSLWPEVAGCGPEVVMDFRARPAGAGLAHGPEIVLLVQAEDSLFAPRQRLWPRCLPLHRLREDGDVELFTRDGEILQ